jgi:hypothetical protein
MRTGSKMSQIYNTASKYPVVSIIVSQFHVSQKGKDFPLGFLCWASRTEKDFLCQCLMSQFTDRSGLFLSCLRLVIQIRTFHDSVSYYALPNLFLTVLTMFQTGFGIETVLSYLGEGKLFLEQRNLFYDHKNLND